MAVIEIAKIQVRRGQENQTGVPLLDGGEFAWAADTEKLYIGLRRDDGGSRDANVEILTENHLRNFFDAHISTSTSQIQYVYREGTDITNYDTQGEVVRRVNEKLDDIVSVKDFQVFGVEDGGTVPNWDLARLQFAIDKLFLNSGSLTPHPAKKLYFPAGNYMITGTLFIPANTTIIGDGIGKTVLTMTTNEAMFKTCDMSSVPNAYKTFDSNGGSGADFTTAGAPTNINIEDLTLQVDNTATTITSALKILSLDCASNSIIQKVEFKGNHNYTSNVTTSAYVALDIRGLASIGNESSVIKNCVFTNFFYGITSNTDIKTTVIRENEFTDLNRGIVFNEPIDSIAIAGPQYVKIEDNKFDYIERQAIYVGSNNSELGSYITSQNNVFGNVGNYVDVPNTTLTSGTSIITYESKNNASINDYFERFEFQNSSNAFGDGNLVFIPLVEGRVTFDNSFVIQSSVSVADTTVFRFPINQSTQHLNIKYSTTKVDGFFVTATVATLAATGTVSIELASTDGAELGYNIKGPGIPANTLITGTSTTTSAVYVGKISDITAGQLIQIFRPINRMGDVRAYIQNSFGNGIPENYVVDDFNYVIGDPTDITFGIDVLLDKNCFEISVTPDPDLYSPLTINLQTRLMI